MPQVSQGSRLLALIVLLAATCSLAAAEPPRDAREVANLFAEAWNAHDPAGFGALMAEDADWVTASGIRLRGRDRIQAYLSEEHATWAKRTSMSAKNIHVRPLDGKTAVVLFEWEITTPGEGGSASVSRGNNLFIVTFDKHWTIASGQVARARAQ